MNRAAGLGAIGRRDPPRLPGEGGQSRSLSSVCPLFSVGSGGKRTSKNMPLSSNAENVVVGSSRKLAVGVSETTSRLTKETVQPLFHGAG